MDIAVAGGGRVWCGAYLPVVKDGLFESGKVREAEEHVKEGLINLPLALPGGGAGGVCHAVYAWLTAVLTGGSAGRRPL